MIKWSMKTISLTHFAILCACCLLACCQGDQQSPEKNSSQSPASPTAISLPATATQSVIAELEKYVEMHPEESDAQTRLALLYQRTGKNFELSGLLGRLQARANSPEKFAELAALNEFVGRNVTAELLIDNISTATALSEERTLMLVDSALRLGLHKHAVVYSEKLIRQSPQPYTRLWALSALFLSGGKYTPEKAIPLFQLLSKHRNEGETIAAGRALANRYASPEERIALQNAVERSLKTEAAPAETAALYFLRALINPDRALALNDYTKAFSLDPLHPAYAEELLINSTAATLGPKNLE
jgi:tetratricopeptide (TPR) repeat protein